MALKTNIKWSSENLTAFAFLAIVLIFGINFIFVGISNRELSPFWGASLRYFLASLMIWTIVLAKKLPKPNKEGVIGAIFYGLFAFGGNAGLLYWALKFTSPPMAAVICSVTPLITLLISSISGLEKVTLRGAFAGTVVGIGIYIIFRSQLSENVSIMSILAILGACVFAALSTIILKFTPKMNPVVTNAIGMTAGSQILFIFSLLSKESILIPTKLETWSSLIWLILSSTFAFILMVWIIPRWNVSKVSYTSVLSPIVTTGISLLFAKQAISTHFLLGSFVVLAGVASVIRLNVTYKT